MSSVFWILLSLCIAFYIFMFTRYHRYAWFELPSWVKLCFNAASFILIGLAIYSVVESLK